jgi:hypothetical protein
VVAIRPSLTSPLGHSANIRRPFIFMVIGNIHPMIGEATRQCVQHVYKHCWKCRDVACHTKVPPVQLYLHGMPLELLKACMHGVASRTR